MQSNQLNSIIEFFKTHPEALDPAAKHVDVIETHISAVLLTERLVFKFKKAVDFPFIHQSSFSERLANCMREVEFNLRLAPDVYVAVRGAYALDAGGYTLLPSTNGAVEACVVMHRLDEATNLLSRIKNPQSQQSLPALLEKTAEILADFHADTIGISLTAGLHAFRANLEENLNALESVSAFSSQNICKRIRDLWQTQQALLGRRDRMFAVVNGHGDLRLDHIYLDQQGQVRIIDCVEFNPRIRAVDPWEDIAFTSMALRFEGRPDLADRLLCAYASAGLDVQGLALLRLFELYRATVRAKIDSINIALKTGNVARFETRVNRYAQLCDEILSAPPRPPSIDVVFGLPATGKSTRALELSRQGAAVIISTDLVRKRLAGRRRYQHGGDEAFQGIYARKFTLRTYAAAHGLAARAARAGYPVVLDGTYSEESQRLAARRLAESAGIPIRFHLIQTELSTIQDRLRERSSRESTSDLVDFATWLKVREAFQPLSDATSALLA